MIKYSSTPKQKPSIACSDTSLQTDWTLEENMLNQDFFTLGNCNDSICKEYFDGYKVWFNYKTCCDETLPHCSL